MVLPRTRPSGGVTQTSTVSLKLPLLAVAVTLVLWASAFVAIRGLADAFSPGALTLGRLVVGSLVLGTVLARTGWQPVERTDRWRLATVGLLWFGLYNIALNAGEQRVDAGTAALLIQTSPILVALLAFVALGERSSRMLWIGSTVSFAGVAIIAVAAESQAGADLWGVVLCVVSAAAYAVSIVVQKPVMQRLHALQVIFCACTVGVFVCLPFLGQLTNEVMAASWEQRGWLVYLGVFPTAVAFTTYAFALTYMSASSLSVTTYLVPVITVLLSWLVLAETPAPATYIGGFLALVGVAISRRRSAPAVA